MKLLILATILLVTCGIVRSQQLISTKPALLEVYGKTTDSSEFTVESKNFEITIQESMMKGVLQISSLTTANERAQSYLDQIEIEEIRFEIQLPDGTFVFGNSLNKKVTQEGDIFCGDHKSNFIIEFIVSNEKTSKVNAFQIVGTGNLKIDEHLGIEVPEGLENEFRFRFSLSLRQIKL
jgi:hypothetical protein